MNQSVPCIVADGIFFRVKNTGRTKIMTTSSKGENRTFDRSKVRIEQIPVRAWNIQVGGARTAKDYALADAFMEELAHFGTTYKAGDLYNKLKASR